MLRNSSKSNVVNKISYILHFLFPIGYHSSFQKQLWVSKQLGLGCWVKCFTGNHVNNLIKTFNLIWTFTIIKLFVCIPIEQSETCGLDIWMINLFILLLYSATFAHLPLSLNVFSTISCPFWCCRWCAVYLKFVWVFILRTHAIDGYLKWGNSSVSVCSSARILCWPRDEQLCDVHSSAEIKFDKWINVFLKQQSGLR